jgi:coiled-coil domain-containing protein 64
VSGNGDDDFYAQLQQREKNLQLAAEIGKGLVLENEELKRANEQLHEDFNHKVEELTQENHRLKRQVASAIAESRLAESEHQADIEDLQRKLDELARNAQSRERLDKQMIDELTQRIEQMNEKNERLNEQLLNETENEERLREQVNVIRLSVSASSDADQDYHRDQVEMLKNQMAEMETELEQRLALKTKECDVLASDLERANERLSAVDGNIALVTEKLRHLEEEVQRQEDINMQLLLKLENMSMSSVDSTSASMVTISPSLPATQRQQQEMSLFAELELLSNSLSVGSFGSRPTAMKQVTIGTQLKQEILEVFRQLQRLTLEVQGRTSEWSPEAVDISDLHAGQLLTMLTELRSLVNKRLLQSLPHQIPEKSPCVEVLQRQIAGLREQLSASQTRSGSLEAELTQRDRQLIRKCDELKMVQMQLAVAQSDLAKIRKEKDDLLDKSAGTLGVDDVLSTARGERDAALETCENLRQELSKAHIDISALDRQLLDAVSQKLLLSQQLEAWQSDMQDLIEHKMADEIARDRTKKTSSITSSLTKTDGTAIVASTTSPSTKKHFLLRWS